MWRGGCASARRGRGSTVKDGGETSYLINMGNAGRERHLTIACPHAQPPFLLYLSPGSETPGDSVGAARIPAGGMPSKHLHERAHAEWEQRADELLMDDPELVVRGRACLPARTRRGGGGRNSRGEQHPPCNGADRYRASRQGGAPVPISRSFITKERRDMAC